MNSAQTDGGPSVWTLHRQRSFSVNSAQTDGASGNEDLQSDVTETCTNYCTESHWLRSLISRTNPSDIGVHWRYTICKLYITFQTHYLNIKQDEQLLATWKCPGRTGRVTSFMNKAQVQPPEPNQREKHNWKHSPSSTLTTEWYLGLREQRSRKRHYHRRW